MNYQFALVLGTVLAAALFVVSRALSTLSTKRGGECGDCSCGKTSLRNSTEANRGASIVPLARLRAKAVSKS